MRENSPGCALAGVLALLLGAAAGDAWAQGDAKRGQYLAKAGGCLACHTEEKKDAVPFAGGWTEADFIRAMREGDRPDGKNYFPAFPYPSFTKISDGDLRDLWAYLRTLPPSAHPSKEHDLWFFFGWRWVVSLWKWFFFTPGPFTNIPGLSEIANRGAYL